MQRYDRLSGARRVRCAHHPEMISQDLPVCREDSATGRLKSGAGNDWFTSLAKIRFWGVTFRTKGSEKTSAGRERQLTGCTTREPLEPRNL